MTIIITGASSFIGKAVASELNKRNHHCITVRHSLNELSQEELEAMKSRIASYGNDEHVAVLHFAWAGVGSAGRSDAGIQKYNIEMSLETLRIAGDMGVGRFIFAGSQAEYGNSEYLGSGEFMQSEDNICHPVSEYGKAKLEFGRLAAELCEEYNRACEYSDGDAAKQRRGIKLIHTRIFSVYGELDHETSLVNTCIDNFMAGKAMDFGAAVQDWNYMYINDAVRALILLCEYDFEDDRPELINIAGEEIHPLRWYIERMSELCGSDSMKNFGVLPDRAEGNTSLRPDTSRLRALGFKELVSFDEGIGRLIEFKRNKTESAE